MARLVVMYRTPKDAAAFDKHYAETHIPLAKKLPGLKKLELSDGPVMAPAGASDFHLIATLHFEDLSALQDALISPEGRAAGADVEAFATGGVDMFVFSTKEA